MTFTDYLPTIWVAVAFLGGCSQSATPARSNNLVADTLKIDGAAVPDPGFRSETIAISPSFQVAILGSQNQAVYIFDSALKLSRVLPLGVQVDACCLTFESDYLWFHDRRRRTYESFDLAKPHPAAELRATADRPASGLLARVVVGDGGHVLHHFADTVFSDGSFGLIHQILGEHGRVLTEQVLAIPRLASERNITNRSGTGTSLITQPFGARRLVAISDRGEVAVASTDKYAITVYDPLAKRSRILRGKYALTKLSWRERLVARRQLDRMTQTYGLPGPPFDVPEYKPVLRDMGFSQDGRLWVVTSTYREGVPVADMFTGSVRSGSRLWPQDLRIDGWSLRDENAYGEVSFENGQHKIARIDFGRLR